MSLTWQKHGTKDILSRQGGLVVMAMFVTQLGVSRPACGAEYSPLRSLFVAVDIGGGLDLSEEDRSPSNYFGHKIEAYSLGSFIVGLTLGYRFNEIFGLEGAWFETQHKAHPEWGGLARYTTGHISARFSIPLKTRQTPVFKLGAAVGGFAYGASSIFETEDNNTLVAGPRMSIGLEHELILGLVVTFEISYLPLYRKGMNGVLLLEEVTYHQDGGSFARLVGSKDFTDSSIVHLLGFTAGIHYEWAIQNR